MNVENASRISWAVETVCVLASIVMIGSIFCSVWSARVFELLRRGRWRCFSMKQRPEKSEKGGGGGGGEKRKTGGVEGRGGGRRGRRS